MGDDVTAAVQRGAPIHQLLSTGGEQPEETLQKKEKTKKGDLVKERRFFGKNGELCHFSGRAALEDSAV